MMPGASFSIKQRLSLPGKTHGGAEGYTKGRAGIQFLSYLRRKDE